MQAAVSICQFLCAGILLYYGFPPEGRCQVLVKDLIQRDEGGRGDFFCGSSDILSLSLALSFSLAHLLLQFGSAQHPRHGEQDRCFLLAKTVVVVEFVPRK